MSENNMKNSITRWPGRILMFACLGLLLGNAHALPALQLGPGDTGWSYNEDTETWEVFDDPFTLKAYANADPGNGAYAWDSGGASTQTAYLIAAAVPKTLESDGDVFDITISNATRVVGDINGEGFWGTPPDDDKNSLASHGIYDTYYEIYEFNFDDPSTTIPNTQPEPEEPGSGNGYMEAFEVTINSLLLAGLQIHFDIFTLTGDGIWDPTGEEPNIVKAFGPFSHDAQYVPIPAAVWLFGTAILGLVGLSRKKFQS